MSILPAKASTFQNAIDKSRKLGGVRTVRKIRDGLYVVPSATPGVNYVVGVTDRNDFECSCQAGRRGIPCHHAASTYLARAGETMGAAIPKAGRLDGQEVRL